MSNSGDFVMKNTVLERYTGPGGEAIIPEGVKVIGTRAFRGCTAVEWVIIPEGVRVIGEYAFQGLTNLERVVSPAAVESIASEAFHGCANLREFVVDPGNSVFRGDGGALMGRYYDSPPGQFHVLWCAPTAAGVYDLGGNTVTITMAQDLTLSLFVGTAQKAVKSIPKKYEAAKADLAELRKNSKKVVKARTNRLFEQFLSGGAKDGAAIDSAGQPCTVSDSPVAVAHPLEMTPEDTATWQRYFNNNGIRQPFAQVWEPVTDSQNIKEDRYSGIEVPAYRFKGQEKHGICFDFDYTGGVNEHFADFDPLEAFTLD